MEVLTTKKFGNVELACYKAENEADEFWATREQIGQLLGYKYPNDSIRRIHERYPERLSKFSTSVKLTGVEGDRTVTRDVIVYNFKGLLEICRYSNQPVANQVIDFLWEVADEIRQHGMYLSGKALEAFQRDPKLFNKMVECYEESQKKIAELEKKIEDSQSYTTLAKVVLGLPGSITFQEAANFLAQHGFKTGQNRLYKMCREKKFLCSRRGRQFNRPTQRAVERGLFSVETRGGFKPVTLITPEGLRTLSVLYSEQDYPLLLQMETEQTALEG